MVRRGDPRTSAWGGPWSESVGLVHGPGVSVFRLPIILSVNKSFLQNLAREPKMLGEITLENHTSLYPCKLYG